MVNKTLVKTAIECFGRLDGLICHAGELGLGSISDLTIEDWQVTFRTNVDSVFYLLKFALPEMLKRPQASVVINASIAAFKSFPNHPAYCASKAAANTYLATLRLEVLARGVGVSWICPGLVETPFIEKAELDPAHDLPRLARWMVRHLTAEEVARATVRAVEANRREVVMPFMMRMFALTRRIAPGFGDWLNRVSG